MMRSVTAQHCAAGPDCVNAKVLDDFTKVGYFFGNSLTDEGELYLKDAVIEDVGLGYVDSVACTVWMPYYDWIDYGVTCDGCDTLAVCNGDGLCSGCAN